MEIQFYFLPNKQSFILFKYDPAYEKLLEKLLGKRYDA